MIKIYWSFLLLCFLTIPALAQVTSNFEIDADGWTCSDNNLGSPLTVNYNSTGGNPGGYISASTTSSQPFFWTSPSQFGGNIAYFSYGQNLTFDIQLNHVGTVHGASNLGDVQIRIPSGQVLSLNLPTFPAQAPAWSTFSVRLDETAGWRVGNTSGPLATQAQMLQFLSGVHSFRFSIKYTSSTTVGGAIDNVVLDKRPLMQSPYVSSLSSTSGKPGSSITINGSNFDPLASNNVVFFGAQAGTITNASATSLTVTVPPGATYGNIIVINKTTGLAKLSPGPFIPTFDDGGRIIPASLDPKFDLNITGGYGGHAIADIDGDGWSDLVVARQDNSGIWIYRNLGAGGTLSVSSFAAPVSFPTLLSGTNGSGLKVVDLDNDGKLDMVTSGWTGGPGAFATFRNISTPGNLAFEAVEHWNGRSDESPVYTAADIDGDGLPELIGGEGSGGAGQNVWITQNMSSPGNIVFGYSLLYFSSTLDDAASGATIADLDNDGKPEFILTTNFGGSFVVLQNTSTPGTISFGTNFTITQGINGNINVADFNLDGKNDLAWKNGFSNDDIHIRINTNSGGVLTVSDFTTEIILDGDVTTYGALSMGDINGDGKPEMLATDNGDLGIFENVYTGGTFDATAFIPGYRFQGNGGSTYPSGALAGDLNGDNRPDIVVGITNTSPNRLSIYENNNIHAPVISVSTVSPLKGAVGSTVTITGNNFSTTPSDNLVWFGAVNATVLTASENLLTVQVPPGATTNAPVSVTKNGLTSRYHLPFQTTFGPGVTFDNTHFAPPISYTLTGANYDIEAGDLNHDGTVDILAEAGGIAYAFRNDYTTGAITTSTLIANDTLGPGAELFGNPRLEDFDGDGYLDIASINTRLRRNVTTGSNINFTPNITFAGQGNLAYADFNQDGKIDLAISNTGAAQLLLVENRTVPGDFTTGTYGSFSATFAIGKAGVGGEVTAADFDADGFPDVVTVNPTTDNISVFRNLGGYRITATQFAARADVAVGDNPGRIYKGDFDSDGKVDLLLYHGAGTTPTLLIVLQNTSTVGNISFNRIDLTNPSATTVATIADLDGDGKPEIITTSEAGNRFSIFKNIHTSGALTAGSFATPFNTTVTAPRGITTGDLNLDGKPEIILTRAAGFLVVYENLITSIQPPTITSFNPSSGPVGTTVTIIGTNFSTNPADNIVYFGATRAVVTAASITQLTVNVPFGATYAPISVLNITADLLAYSMNKFIPTFTPNKCNITAADLDPKTDFTTGANPISVSIGDLDGDGKADLAVANTASNTVSVLRNTSTGSGTISYAAKVDFPAANDPETVAIGDLDGDGKLDLAVANYIGFSVSVFRNTSIGAGNINFATKVDFALGSPSRFVAIGDLDGDGKPDLAAVGETSHVVSVFRNISTGPGNISYGARVDFATGAGSGPRSLSIDDFDGDGKADLAVGNFNINTLSVFRNTSTGAGNISFAAKEDLTTGTNPSSVTSGDFDGDGKLDLAALNLNSNTLSVFRNTSSVVGNISYATKIDYATGIATRSITAGDLDGDSKADLFVTNHSSGTVSIFRNTSIGAANISYAARVDFTTAPGSIFASVGDLDNDGKSDLAVANASSNSVSIIRNNPVFSTITNFTPPSGPIGTEVTITGTNFSTTPAENVIQFNGLAAIVTASTSTTITTSVPAGATTGPISVSIGCNTLVSITDFVVTAAGSPTITSFTPSSGPVGTTVTITGTNFSTTPANNTVAFNGTTASVTTSTATSITTTVPSGAATGKITVTVAGNTATSTNDFTVTTVSNQPPVISTTTTSTIIGGLATINLLDLISDTDNNLVLSSLAIVQQPTSGASAVITNGILEIDYMGINFSGRDQVTIQVCDVFGECVQQILEIDVIGDIEIYNGISPNNDDQNEIFLIRYIDLLPDTQNNKVTIYNRWGSKVFEVENYNNTTNVFRGLTDNGNELPSGTYFYKIAFVDPNRKSEAGYLTLKR